MNPDKSAPLSMGEVALGTLTSSDALGDCKEASTAWTGTFLCFLTFYDDKLPPIL
jgi:hypothetical protein